MAFFVVIMATPYFFKPSEYTIQSFSISQTTGWSLFVVTIVALFFATIGIDKVEDTGLYHHQMIN